MKIVLRTLILLCMVTWIGAELFFPFVAYFAFTTLTPDTHTAGRIVGACLRVIHYEGLVAGGLLMVLVLLGRRIGIVSLRSLRISLVLLAVMVGLTAVSQFGIIPRMEVYRIAAGGSVDAAAAGDPSRTAFERLHKTSEYVEEAILLCGLVLLGVLATPESSTRHTA
jgi:Domain of unknown function (DUF4149)